MGRFEVPVDAPTKSFQEVQDMVDVNDPTKLYIILNGKVLHYLKDDGKISNPGVHIELRLSKMLYDPKYGNADKI